jgi:hypothetical protein
MLAKAWSNGSASIDSPGGYGLEFAASDRDRFFDRSWEHIVVELDGSETVKVTLSDSFWRRCPEIHSAGIGRWLQDVGAAPWPKGNRPGIAVTPIEGNRFSARLIKRQTLTR